jgi:hypothetical protein
LALVALVALWGAVGAAQDTASLKRDIEAQFEVLPLQEGVALRPKRHADVRSVEVRGGAIALDGADVTGAELRQRLGRDADPVIRLSYLDAAAQRALFAPAPAPGTAAPGPPPAAAPLPEPPEPPQPPRRGRVPRVPRQSHGGDRVRFGGGVRVENGEVVNGDVVGIGGAVYVDGEVHGDVVGIGGGVDLGPDANISGDVTAVGGPLHRDPDARIGGSVNEVGGFDLRALRGRWWVPGAFLTPGWAWGSLFALTSTLARFAVLSLLVCIVLLISREYVERVGARAAAEPLKAGLIGLCAELLFLPLLVVTIVVLVVTIIGIPLLALIPFALLGVAIVFLVGFTAVAHHLGQVLAGRMRWSSGNPYLTTLLGILAILSPVLVARVLGLAGGILFPITAVLVAAGFGLEYIAWTIGLGAVALLRFQRTAVP